MSRSEFSAEASDVPEYGTDDLIMHELYRLKYISLLPTTDMMKYISPSDALELVKKEIHLTDGRISLSELQILCNLEMSSIDQVTRELIHEDSSNYQLSGGDIIHNSYFLHLAKEINLLVKWEGSVSIASLSSKFHLPMEMITEIVRANIGGLICGSLRVSIIFSEHYIQKQYSLLRGLCLGTKAPLQLSQLTTQVTGLDETAIFRYICDLIESQELKGTCSAKEYVPESFQHHQRQMVDEYFGLYGILELNRLTSVYGVSGKLLDFVRVSFPDALQLSTSIISADTIKPLERQLKEVATATPQDNVSNEGDLDWNGTGGIPWLHVPTAIPSGLPSVDEEPLLNYILETGNCRDDIIEIPTSDGLYFVNKRFFSWIQKCIENDCQQVEKTLLIYFKSQVEKSVSISSNTHTGSLVAHLPDDDEGNSGKGKKGKKGGKARGVAEPETIISSGSGKKSESKKKALKDSVEQPSIMNTISPYIEDHRMISLLKEWCQQISDFSEGIVHSDSESFDDEEESSHLLDPLYFGLWEMLRDSSTEKYKAVANRAKEEAAQGGASDRMKREQERDKKFDIMWNELQVVAKAIGAFENRQMDAENATQTSSLHQFLLRTRCAKIVELLTVYACWECGVEFKCVEYGTLLLEDEGKNDESEADHMSTTSSKDGQSHHSRLSKLSLELAMPTLTLGNKQMLQRVLTKETSVTLLKLWSFVTSGRHTFWEFYEYLESCVSCGALNLVGHKIDKKKERTISFTMKQTVMDRLRSNSNIEECLPLIATLAVHQVSGAILEFPNLHETEELFEYLMTWLGSQTVLTEEEMLKLRQLRNISREVQPTQVTTEYLEEVKGYVLKKK